MELLSERSQDTRGPETNMSRYCFLFPDIIVMWIYFCDLFLGCLKRAAVIQSHPHFTRTHLCNPPTDRLSLDETFINEFVDISDQCFSS